MATPRTENKHALVPDPAAAQVVRQVFQWYAQGLGQGGIAQKLNEAHVPNPGL
ncbi:MAG: recombinase family protein [Evtepia sp.]